jgi:spermidine/putrescine transport system substrate-binding protein
LVAGYYDQSYIQHLENGDTWITQAWSGDVFQANQSGYPHLKFVTPVEGQAVWHDNMVILRQAANPLDALEWMNFYYTPKIAGIVEDWVNYVCPVPDAQAYILDALDDPTVANSPLVFPTKAMNNNSHEYYVFKDYDEYQQWNDIFNAIIES